MKKVIINTKEAQNGITLIALVITIIVLLILAGVSIAMLTGQNGILTQAQSAKTTTENKSAEEKVKLAVMSARARSETASLEIDKLKEEITNQGGTATNNEFPLNVTMDGKSFTVSSTGVVTATGSSDQTPTGQGTLGTVSGNEIKNTTVKDSLGNQVVVPAGFKVINPKDNVTDGIVIEDVSHEATAGSQFVWIPVGDVIKDNEGNKETITLGRYVFNEDGTVNTDLSKTEPGDQLKTNSSSLYYYTEGLNNSETDNTHAKDIVIFKSKAESNHGYYIGRYESRTSTQRTSKADELTQITVKPDEYVYNYTTQLQVAELSRGMYSSDSNFESDLMNSYAWDTAVYFLQTFDNRANKESLKPYSMQNRLNYILASKGTNNLSDTSKQDVICNVWDMASNCREWTTETYSLSSNPCTNMGGYYNDSDHYTSYRLIGDTTSSDDHISFRTLLYM